MSRFKRIAQAAAAAFIIAAGALTAQQAWDQANTEDVNPFKARDWKTQRDKLRSRHVEAFVIVDNGHTIPESFTPLDATGERWLGICDQPNKCHQDLAKRTYRYDRARFGLVANRRVWRIEAHPYFIGSWKKYAADTAAVDFIGARKDFEAGCEALHTQAQCRDMMHGLDPCWLNANGDIQRFGYLYGPGNGGSVVAQPTPQQITNGTWTWLSCDVRFGEDPIAKSTVAAIPPDADLEILE